MQIKPIIQPTEQNDILKLLVKDMEPQYKQAQTERTQNDGKNVSSLDYTQYIPYEYRTLDRMALLLTGNDVCNAVCVLPNRGVSQLTVARNMPEDETEEQREHEMNIKKLLLTQFKTVASLKEKGTAITPQQYNEYLKTVITLAKEQDFLASVRQQKMQNKEQNEAIKGKPQS